MEKRENSRKSVITSRETTDSFLEEIVRIFPRWISPNHLTAISFLLAVISAFFYYSAGEKSSPLYLLGALLFLIFASALDAVDGALARARGSCSERGNYFDHVIDRFVDVSLLVGIIFGGWIDYRIGMMAGFVILIVSYLGAEAEAKMKARTKDSATKREYRGIMGRAIRLVILIVATFFNMFFIDFTILGLTIIGLAVVAFLIGGIITIIQRFYYTWKALS